MIKLIVGNKGSGKTKILLDLTKEALKESKGHVVFIEKGPKLTFDLPYNVRLIDTDKYGIKGFDSFYGFISGVCAGDYDVTDIFIDSTLKICGNDLNEFHKFAQRLKILSEYSETKFVVSVSAGTKDLPQGIDARIIAP